MAPQQQAVKTTLILKITFSSNNYYNIKNNNHGVEIFIIIVEKFCLLQSFMFEKKKNPCITNYTRVEMYVSVDNISLSNIGSSGGICGLSQHFKSALHNSSKATSILWEVMYSFCTSSAGS